MAMLTLISSIIAVIALFITVRTIILSYNKVKKSDKITFIKGEHKITVSGRANKEDSKRLMHL
jgi:hypothetical protein